MVRWWALVHCGLALVFRSSLETVAVRGLPVQEAAGSYESEIRMQNCSRKGRILEEDHTEQKQKADRQTIQPSGGERQRPRR
jgi:hypothetical protein